MVETQNHQEVCGKKKRIPFYYYLQSVRFRKHSSFLAEIMDLSIYQLIKSIVIINNCRCNFFLLSAREIIESLLDGVLNRTLLFWVNRNEWKLRKRETRSSIWVERTSHLFELSCLDWIHMQAKIALIIQESQGQKF